jgi:hypothetical protein
MIWNNKPMILLSKKEAIFKFYSNIVSSIIDHLPSSFNTHLYVAFLINAVLINIFHCKENNLNIKLMVGNINVSLIHYSIMDLNKVNMLMIGISILISKEIKLKKFKIYKNGKKSVTSQDAGISAERIFFGEEFTK